MAVNGSETVGVNVSSRLTGAGAYNDARVRIVSIFAFCQSSRKQTASQPVRLPATLLAGHLALMLQLFLHSFSFPLSSYFVLV